MNQPRRSSSNTSEISRWMPAIAAISVLGIVLAVATSGAADRPPASAAANATVDISTSVAAPVGEVALTVPLTTLAPVVIDTTPVVKTALDRTLVTGVFGDDVKALQIRLAELGFVPGVADGAFGDQTRQAVWAFEKLVQRVPRNSATGKVTNEMWQLMQDKISVQPRRPGVGTHMEIYLPEQAAAVFTDNVPTRVMHISSGTGEEWCETVSLDTDNEGNKLEVPLEKPVCGVSKTPGGVFRFKRQVEGDRVGALGRMFNPIYFNFGIAVHGAREVPLHPASHGCIRIHRTISDTLQTYVRIRDYVFVWGEDGKEPENYTKSERTPVFNYTDPNATTTTSTTTTVKTTTAPATKATTPAATVAPETTTPPAAAASTTTASTTTTVKPAATTTTAEPPPTSTTA